MKTLLTVLLTATCAFAFSNESPTISHAESEIAAITPDDDALISSGTQQRNQKNSANAPKDAKKSQHLGGPTPSSEKGGKISAPTGVKNITPSGKGK